MPRPQKYRRIGPCAPAPYFKPQGIPFRMLETVELALDELEAIRLADFEELYQQKAAEKMEVSRQTFGLIIARARKKIAEALTQGKAIRIESGTEISLAELPIYDHIRGNGIRKKPRSNSPRNVTRARPAQS